MEHQNGTSADGLLVEKSTLVNGCHPNGLHEPNIEELDRELPTVDAGQVSLGDLVSRVIQAIYAELTELSETMPNMSDLLRKRTLADWVVKTKKQVVKLYALAKWSRDADTVQKCMNITAFLLNQNRQFQDAIETLKHAKEGLDPARLRNHDLLTSLDVLTTGSYRRLPSCIQKAVLHLTPLTDLDVLETLTEIEEVMRYRLRMTELIPIEMSRYRIKDGRVWFTVPKLFQTSICLRGAEKDAGWFLLHVEFLMTISGEVTTVQEFPRIPSGLMKQHIVNEADSRLAFYLPPPADRLAQPGVDVPPRRHLPPDVADAPLVRLYNFLQMMSLSYQLEILWYQAMRMRSLGWADYLKVEMSNKRKTLVVSYWIRQPPRTIPGRQPPRSRIPVPLVGGTLTVSIINVHVTGQGSARSPKAKVLYELQQASKLGGARPSDEVERLEFEVNWEPTKGALGVLRLSPEFMFSPGELSVDANDLNLESLLHRVVERHTQAILAFHQLQIQRSPLRTVFSVPGVISQILANNLPALRIYLCPKEAVTVTIDPRTGRLNIRNTSDLAAAGRSQHFEGITDWLNQSPASIMDALIQLRQLTIIDLAEQQAHYLGLYTHRTRNFSADELLKLGPAIRGKLFIQLSNFPKHYLVLVITDEDVKYALISVEVHTDGMYDTMSMVDIAWLDVHRIHGHDIDILAAPEVNAPPDQNRHGIYEREFNSPRFGVDAQVLRELYSYCCARVTYAKVENQLKHRHIPCRSVSSPSNISLAPELAHLRSSLARSVPALCVQSSDILSGAPAAEAAMPNIRIIPLNWWSEKKPQVVTCVKLKYVQQPMGKTAGTSNIIRPSKRIIYDTSEAIVSFLSEEVDTCVDEFLKEWARVSKMVVIAREVAQMSKLQQWPDVRLLFFDLQTVELAYAEDYAVSITCTDQLTSLSGGSFDLRFSRCGDSEGYNPHSDAEPFFRNIFRHAHGRLAKSLQRLILLLRDTLPIVAELEELRALAERDGEPVDTFAKAAGWYRMLYGDLRHALDWRLMSDGKTVILDASTSLFQPTRPLPQAEWASSATAPDEGSSSADGGSLTALQPIPGFVDVIAEAMREVMGSDPHLSGSKMTSIDVGVICNKDAVRAVGRALHLKVLGQLKK